MAEWTVIKLDVARERGGRPDVVERVHWKCVDGDDVDEGMCPVDPPRNGPDFVPYNRLTREIVLAWVFAKLGKDRIEQRLVRQRNERATPPVRPLPLPWE